jgi:hypothetical protein
MGCYERSDVEDVTGCIPLLLDKRVVSRKVDLTVVVLREIYGKAVDFDRTRRPPSHPAGRFGYWQKPWGRYASETPQGPGDLTTGVTGKPVLYRLEICNFPAIDGMIVLIKSKGGEEDKSKLLIVPIQVTVNLSSHADSHATFVKDYIKWTKSLSEFDVELEFVWITPEEDRVREHQAESKSKCPKHKGRYVPFKGVSEGIWWQYQNAPAVAR